MHPSTDTTNNRRTTRAFTRQALPARDETTGGRSGLSFFHGSSVFSTAHSRLSGTIPINAPLSNFQRNFYILSKHLFLRISEKPAPRLRERQHLLDNMLSSHSSFHRCGALSQRHIRIMPFQQPTGESCRSHSCFFQRILRCGGVATIGAYQNG